MRRHTMPKRKYPYGKRLNEWKEPGDYYVDDRWMCYYTDTGSGHSGMFTVKKALRSSEEFKDNPDEAIRAMIADHQTKRRAGDTAGEGPESKKGKKVAATEAATVAAAAGHVAESVKRAPAPVTPMNLSEGRNRDYEAERRSAAERREHRWMAEVFGHTQKLVDEEMDEDGSDMCHILKLVAMAIFSQHGGSELGPSSPEEKLRLVADLVSSELQGMIKQHKAASVGGAAGKQLPGVAAAGVVMDSVMEEEEEDDDDDDEEEEEEEQKEEEQEQEQGRGSELRGAGAVTMQGGAAQPGAGGGLLGQHAGARAAVRPVQAAAGGATWGGWSPR